MKTMITRSDIEGALKVLNANNVKNRRSALEAMFLKEHSSDVVKKILGDLKSYPQWSSRMDLEPKSASTSAIPDDA